MTINYARESVIDFTKPFMNLGIGILYKVSYKSYKSTMFLYKSIGSNIYIFRKCNLNFMINKRF